MGFSGWCGGELVPKLPDRERWLYYMDQEEDQSDYKSSTTKLDRKVQLQIPTTK